VNRKVGTFSTFTQVESSDNFPDRQLLKLCGKGIPERIVERNTNVVFWLLGQNRKRCPRQKTRENPWEQHKGLLSVGQEQETLPRREYQRESMRVTQWLSIVFWATTETFPQKEHQRETMKEAQWLSIVRWARTENVAPERISERIDERNTKVVYCLRTENVSSERMPERIDESNPKVVYCMLGQNKNVATERIPERIDESNTKVVYCMLGQNKNVATERIPERIDDSNTKVAYWLLGHSRKRCPRENFRENRWEKHKGCLLSVGPQLETFPQREYQRESMRETQWLSLVCWARTGTFPQGEYQRESMRATQKLSVVCRARSENVSPDRNQRKSMRARQRLSIVCWARTENVSTERMPARIDERKTKAVYCLLGQNRKRFPRENISENRWEKNKSCLLSIGPEQKTFPQREYQRESMREKQKLSIVYWARTENVYPERIPERIEENNTNVVCCL
jgi:hypothetical protein